MLPRCVCWAFVVLLGASALLGACSHYAVDVQVDAVPAATYDSLTCQELDIAIDGLVPQVETLRFQLDEHAERERLNSLGQIAYMGLPWLVDRLNSEQKDREVRYARLKGELRAMRESRVAKACPKPAASTPKVGMDDLAAPTAPASAP